MNKNLNKKRKKKYICKKQGKTSIYIRIKKLI